jgi:hypothetical protein
MEEPLVARSVVTRTLAITRCGASVLKPQRSNEVGSLVLTLGSGLTGS